MHYGSVVIVTFAKTVKFFICNTILDVSAASFCRIIFVSARIIIAIIAGVAVIVLMLRKR